MYRPFGEVVEVADTLQVEEKITWTNKVSIFYCSGCGSGVAQPQASLSICMLSMHVYRIVWKEDPPM